MPLPFAVELVRKASVSGQTVACAESCTGGMVAAALTDVAGSSAMFLAGVVSYSNAAKTAMLGVPETLIAAHGAVSEEVACAMAEGVRARSGADIAVSTTGIAGPGGSEFKPEGRVCFAITTPAGTQTETVEFGAIGRDQVREAARDHALTLIGRALGV